MPPLPPAAAVTANNALAASLLSSLAPSAPPRASLFVAPPSVANALALLAAGAAPESESARQLGRVLGEGSGLDGVAALAAAALSAPAGGASGPTVACANSVWAPPDVKFDESYVAAVSRLGAVARPLTSAEDVNGWIFAATAGRIPCIVPSDVAARAVAVLVNALYFKGAWAAAFDAGASGPLPFHRDGRDGGAATTTAHAMRRTVKGAPYARTATVTAVRLAYAGGTHEAVAAVPANAGAPVAATLAAVAAIDAGDEDGWCVPPAGVAVTLPKFSAEWGGDVKAALVAAGVVAPFANGADFAPMLAAGAPPPVSNVLHKVVIDVDEAGTEAAAATAVVMARALLSFPEEFTADVPFLFGVRHVATRAWLFVGWVADVAEWAGGSGAAGGAAATPPQPWQPRGGDGLEPPGVGGLSHPGTEGR